MLKVILSCFLLAIGAVALMWSKEEAGETSCCHVWDAHDQFVALASNQSFVNQHQEPDQINFISKAGGKQITFPTPDGQTGRGWWLPAKKKSAHYLFVFHEWWGLNDHIKAEAEKFYNDLPPVNILCLDLYDGKIATQRQEAAQLMQGLSPQRAEAIVKGAMNYAGPKANIYTIGWCMGGTWSLQAALLAGKQAKGCVIYYGMPEKDVERLKTLHTDVLGIFAGRERWISPQVVEEFAANMQRAGKQLTYKIFDADHAFANPSNPNYAKQAAEEAYALSINYLKERIK
ncbi:MAG: dienelactone hydrolase family protein [Cytophagales bacterium]|nr:dienelactone hydrolase family protein [Bernardetiaceae bacterium]MDW8210109.1 dienelactone hydrolase family protein [Cytophagales bacterium]